MDDSVMVWLKISMLFVGFDSNCMGVSLTLTSPELEVLKNAFSFKKFGARFPPYQKARLSARIELDAGPSFASIRKEFAKSASRPAFPTPSHAERILKLGLRGIWGSLLES